MNIQLETIKEVQPVEQIKPLIDELRAKHKFFNYAVNNTFVTLKIEAKDNEKHNLAMFSDLEQLLASKLQLLSLLDETDDFYQIVNNQTLLLKAHYVQLYNYFERDRSKDKIHTLGQ